MSGWRECGRTKLLTPQWPGSTERERCLDPSVPLMDTPPVTPLPPARPHLLKSHHLQKCHELGTKLSTHHPLGDIEDPNQNTQHERCLFFYFMNLQMTLKQCDFIKSLMSRLLPEEQLSVLHSYGSCWRL